MQKITVLCVGKMKEKFYIQAAEEYVKRLTRFCKIEIVELQEERLPESPSPAQVDAALAREAEAIRGKLPASALVVAMCVEGKLLSSEELSDFLERRAAQGTSHVVFVIGGSFGLHPSIKERAELRLSMSPMTFPHHLARVMLLEQLYRSFKIDEGSSYHK